MTLVVPFPGAHTSDSAVVGGKGSSLIRMAEVGLPVPVGAVLTTEFFHPWFGKLQTTATWTRFSEAPPDEWAMLCPALKQLCLALPLSATQRRALADLRRSVTDIGGDHMLLAVRSSSPEEDLSSVSFAGSYETRLGVRLADLEAAVRGCFASSLDQRVFAYKAEHGFDILSPRIAVVVQHQIDSEIAGVGFSLNPLTNDYDEAVIDANWGLGESVVSGLASPDHFVVDKVTGSIIDKTLGTKGVSIWLGPRGNTVERKKYRSTDETLTETQLAELTDVLCRIEDLNDCPIDVEWAYADGRLYTLQARPITTYVPLAPEMVTRPGERRRLYADASLSKGLTTNEPISPLGLSWIEHMYRRMLSDLLGVTAFSPDGGLVFTAGSRLYMNVSNFMWLGMSTRTMAKNAAATDALLGEILASIDPHQHRAADRPSWLRLRVVLLAPKALWMFRRFFWSALWNILAPERARRAYQQEIDSFETEITERLDYELPLKEFAQRYTERVWREMFDVTMPALLVGLISPDFLIPAKWRLPEELSLALHRGATGNLVVEQGISLYRLAKRLDRTDFDDIDRLVDRIEKRDMPAEFLNEWDTFLRRFGCRGPNEMDVASPRYADDPTLALQQMSYMTGDEADFDPRVAHRRNVEERRRAYQELLGQAGWLRRWMLRRVYRLVESFAGTRDTPKYHAVTLTYAVRKRALIEGGGLVADGRLDTPEQIFDLTFDDLDAASQDTTLDLRQLCNERTRFAHQLSARVAEFPQVIDSRGRIFRPPPRAETPGELVGTAVSPGTVTGPVTVLRNPRDKPVEKGSVIVAYTTDPGWTPLFVNAAAVVLEVGGLLQHGALVAREYGKPCVVGIDRVMTRLHDGQIVEVDGTAGVIRLVS